jgi:protein-S-isoprenylcysteine O-methyltransferase Ste14
MKSFFIAEAAKPRVAAASAIGLELDLGRQTGPIHVGASEGVPEKDVADNIARLLLVGLFTFMAIRFGANFLQTGHFTGLLLLASEALVVVFTVLRRAPVMVDRSVRARVLTTLALVGPPLVAPVALTPLLPDAVTVAVSAVGLLVVIGGKLSLGRSFGLIPANRGIVSTGLYRLVRHPIYLGYLITHVAFLGANPTVWNVAVLVTTDLALLARAVCEERTLARDDAYRAYQTRVRWRVLPGVF